MTVILVLICCSVPNFIKIGARVRPTDAHNCWMFNARLLGNGLCHGNDIIADMSWTWWNATTHISSKSVHWEASYGISNIFQHIAAERHFKFKKKLIFDHVTVVVVLICCCVGPTEFHQDWFTQSATTKKPMYVTYFVFSWQIARYLWWNANRNSHAIYRMSLFPVTRISGQAIILFTLNSSETVRDTVTT